MRAKEMFMRWGIKSVSMDDISQAMGVSKKTLYRVFSDKKGLIACVMNQHMSEVREDIKKIQTIAENPIHELVLIARLMMTMLKQISPHTTHDLKKYYPNHWKKIDRERSELILHDIQSNLEQGIQEGYYRDDLNIDLIANLYLKIAIYVTDEKILDSTEENNVKLYLEFIKYHFRGIMNEKGKNTLHQYEDLLYEK